MRLACLLKGKRRPNTPPNPTCCGTRRPGPTHPPHPPQPNPASPTPRAPTGGRGPACPGRIEGGNAARRNATRPLRSGTGIGDYVTASVSVYEPPRSAVFEVKEAKLDGKVLPVETPRGPYEVALRHRFRDWDE